MASSPDVAAALSAVNAHDMPVHVQMRLAALSGDETITYLDAHQSSTIGGSRTTSGEVVAFTPRLVLQAVFQNSQARLDNPDANSHEATVRVKCWSRRALTTLSIDPDVADHRNTDAEWDDENGRWPARSRLTLTYTGQPVMTLPLSEHRNSKPETWAALPELVKSLHDDLATDTGYGVGSEVL